MGFPAPIRSALAVRRFLSAVSIAGLAGLLLPGRAAAASAALRPGKDTTIYGDGSANLSNGAGAFLFAGSSGEKRVLRSLLAFDLVGQIPAGATVNSVSLTFTINTPLAKNANVVGLHRVLADWGEGSSLAPMGGGGGALATNGGATWNARFFNTATWTTPGGDFAGAASASQPVSGGSGTVTFSSAGLVADVQAWVNNPATNFGWIMVAQDETGPAVRFASREGSPAPSLVVDFTLGSGGGNTLPVLTTQPAGQTVTAGAAVTFAAAASGTPAPAFQWRKNGTPIPGATNATLTLTSVTIADAGTYTVVATNAAGSAISAEATLTVNSGPVGAARLSNLSVRAAMAAGQTLIVGFSMSGGSRSVLVRGVGPTLASFGLGDTMADPRLELYNGGTLVGDNDDWGNGAALSNAFSSVGAFAFLANSRDAALLQSIEGTRSVHLKGTGAGVTLVELYDTGSGNTPRLVNVSARNQVGTGDNILIFGFFIDGKGAKNLLIRAIGPRLADLGVTGVLADPKFEVFRAGTAAAIAGNDNWDPSLTATFNAVGAFGLTAGSRDAALVTPLTPGSYTVQVSGVNGGTGEALVEIYEVP
ncbi:MAG: immunoglobulin domain-containing protein [Verrucomicrobia bacterium]|nr:immunoglobulin domain-containing protein [Verrucomicrobiota bacterium]